MLKIFIAQPSLGDVAQATQWKLRRMQEKHKDKIEFVYPNNCVHRIFHDFARNALVEEFLASSADIIWFLDSDIIPHDDVLDLIVEHGDKWQLAGAPYPVFMKGNKNAEIPVVIFTVYKGEEKCLTPSSIPRKGTEFVEGIATGCLFIKREVFKDLEKPYFEFKFDRESREVVEGEDLGFCKKVIAKGYKFFIDYEKVCRHIKKIDLLDVNNYAIEYANEMLTAYDRKLQDQLTKWRLGIEKPKAAPKSSLILPATIR